MIREEAIKKVRWGLLGLVIDKDVRDALETLIPELAESEDERIRAVILKLVLGMRGEIFTTADKLVTKPKVLAWLEKQKEQNPNVEICPHSIKSKSYKENGYPIEDCVQKPAEWSEEDEEMLNATIDIVSNSLYEPLCPREGMLAWLKSLRPQPKRDGGDDYNKGYIKGRADTLKEFAGMSSWKPSEEQMEVDLEKEIEEYWIATEWSKVITLGKFKVIARYFYGLGQLNSK